ncbi:MAG: aminoglycoside phosphotransferase [Magnetococcales bacterium]|nr:aminoglycoside phosphotransferase [Magnetococcales bacterium]
MITPHAHHFIEDRIGSGFTIHKISGDASFRTYYRVVLPDNATLVFMDAPPDKEDSRPFVDIATFLVRHAVSVPKIFHADVDRGFLLLEDFGDVTFLEALRQGENAKMLYTRAVADLLKLQKTPRDGRCIAHGRPYDRALLNREFALLTDWYIPGILKQTISDADQKTFQVVFDLIIDQVLQQPVVLVHRDFHSRNLMWSKDRVGIIDFQDAVTGPVTYDLASLLRDCYVAWDRPFRDELSQIWLQGAKESLGYRPDPETFARDFDFMAVQRNLKAVGIFGRLSLRDGKHGYLQDVPRTMGYVRETLPRYPELAPLADMLVNYRVMEP